MKNLILSFLAATFFASMPAFAAPTGIAFQGRLAKDGTAVSGAVTLTLTVTSPNADLCTLFEETHTFTINPSDNGVFSVAIGSGTRTGNDEGLTVTNVFSNTGTVINSLACSGSPATSYTPLSTHARYIYVSFNTTVGTVAFADPYVAQSVPYALESEKLAGKTSSEYLQTTAATTQTKLNDIMATTPYTELLALIGGTSSQYVTPGSAISTSGNITQTGATTVSTGTGAISLNGATTIAANRNFSMASGTGTFAQTYIGTGTAHSLVANSVTASAAQSISANALTSGSILSLSSSSTAAAAGNKGLEIAISGANGSPSITRTGLFSSVTSTGATSTNIGGHFSASGATNNYGLIVDSGNVGIGTSAPGSLLTLGGSAARTIAMERNPTAATAGQGLTIDAGGSVLGTANLGGGDLTLISGTSTGNGTSSILFKTAPAGTPGAITDNATTTKMTILGNGFVGIGAPTPSGLLDLYQDNSLSTFKFTGPSGSTSADFAMGRGVTEGTAYAHTQNAIFTSNPTGGSGFPFFTAGNYGTMVFKGRRNSANGGFAFLASNAGSSAYVTALAISPTGDVGIGASAPGQKLEVNGGLALNTATAKPGCSSTTRGTFWFVRSAGGVKDTVEVCAKDAADAYAWRTIY